MNASGEMSGSLASSARLAVIALVISMTGCTGTRIPSINSAAVNNAAPVTESAGEATVPPAPTVEIPERFTRTLDGTIGTFPIRVRLSKDKGRLSGEYVYETGRAASRTVVGMLVLEGTIDNAGAVRMTETVSGGEAEDKQTGLFEGALSNTTLGVRYVGTWKKPDGSGSLPVVLNELTSTPGGMRFVSTEMTSTDRRLAANIRVAYPQAEGAEFLKASALNAAVENFVRERVIEFTGVAVDSLDAGVSADMLALEIDYEIAIVTDEIVSIVFNEYSNFGGAHPSSAVTARTFEFNRGRFIKLTDLSGDTRALLDVLSQTCGAASPSDEAFQIDLSPNAENFAEWYVTRRGMTFVFQVAHVAGDTIQIYLPFSEVKPVLNQDGPLGTLIR